MTTFPFLNEEENQVLNLVFQYDQLQTLVKHEPITARWVRIMLRNIRFILHIQQRPRQVSLTSEELKLLCHAWHFPFVKKHQAAIIQLIQKYPAR